MTHKARKSVVLVMGLSRCLREHRVDDLHDELLLGAWQSAKPGRR
jgi:hypothetical protein